MREIITLGVGQCGNQVSYKFWEALALEHGICPSSGQWEGDDDVQLMRSEVYFNQVDNGRFVPRSVLIDLEPGVLSSVQGCPKMGKFFNPDNFVSGQNGAGNNWAKGYFSDGAEILEDTLDQIRRGVELCESLQAFQIMHSLGGGTGSGLGSLLLERLNEEYADKLSFNFSILPGSTNGGNSDVVVEPYNAVLAMNSLIEHSHATFSVENSALNRICQKQLKMKQPSFGDINHIIAQVMSNTTASLRFPGFQNNCDIRKLSTNLIPFPRLHFLMQGQAPLIRPDESKFEQLGVQQVAQQMFDSRSLLSDVGDLCTQGKVLTASCLFRGKNISALEVETTIAKYKNKKQSAFVEWIPDNMMNSICKAPAAWNPVSNVSGTFLVNSTAQCQTFQGLLGNFEQMLRAKAYVHWYTAEGMDIQEFQEAGHNLRDLISEYQQYQDASVDEGDDGYDEEMEDMQQALDDTKLIQKPKHVHLQIDDLSLDKESQANSSRSNATTMACSDLASSL